MSTPAFSADDPAELTVRLVEIPSVSGGEKAVVGFIHEGLRSLGLEPTLSGRNVWCAVEGQRPGDRTLLLNAHIDTVPPAPGWTTDPWRAKRSDGRIQALGANDTKGGCAGMICAVAELARERDFAGTLLFAATCDEETGGEGLEVLRPELPPITGAVVAEPNGLVPATAQRGMMRIVVSCQGQAAHAARPWQGRNAIEMALQDIQALLAIRAPEKHPLLGRATLTPTLIEGGHGRNVVPEHCRFTIDVRPTPNYPNSWWEEQIRAAVQGDFEEFKGRMVPVETPSDDPLVVAALEACGAAEPVPFGGASDLFFVRDVAAIVMGPGRPDQSHQADEWVEESQVRRARDVYAALARGYLA